MRLYASMDSFSFRTSASSKSCESSKAMTSAYALSYTVLTKKVLFLSPGWPGKGHEKAPGPMRASGALWEGI